MNLATAEKFGITPCIIVTLANKGKAAREALEERGGFVRMADIGLSLAIKGADVRKYIEFLRDVRPHFAICPDAFGNFRETLRLWHRWAPLMRKYTEPVLVIHEPQKYPKQLLHVEDLGITRAAIPLRRHPDAPCAEAPRLCADRAARAMDHLCGRADHIHLLGPALRALEMLVPRIRECERYGTAVSVDTVVYLRMPTDDMARRAGLPPGKRMAGGMEFGMRARALDVWLERVLGR
jgi:hypothetical protein